MAFLTVWSNKEWKQSETFFLRKKTFKVRCNGLYNSIPMGILVQAMPARPCYLSHGYPSPLSAHRRRCRTVLREV